MTRVTGLSCEHPFTCDKIIFDGVGRFQCGA